ncbi:MAG TPA: MscL family protein [Patescibacteria group bacterium]|nr:MscL family protein [Patescibacteria group bacterium]
MATKKTAKQTAEEARKAAYEAKKQAAAAKTEAAKARLAKLGGGPAAGFLNFIREQGVIGLAVGLAVGAAAGASVKSLVDNFINPIVAFMLGGKDLSNLVWDTGLKNGDVELSFGWGAIVNSLIVLFSTALVVYLVIHGAKLDRLDKKKS